MCHNWTAWEIFTLLYGEWKSLKLFSCGTSIYLKLWLILLLHTRWTTWKKITYVSNSTVHAFNNITVAPSYDQLDGRVSHTRTHIFFLHHTTCESTCDTLASSAANQGDNTVSVAQGSTATPGATEQLLPPDRVFKRNIYLCIHKIN